MATNNILEKFSSHFKNILKSGIETAKNLGHRQVEPSHLLLALHEEKGSVGGEFLSSLKIGAEKIRTTLETSQNAVFKDNQPEPEFSQASKKIIEQAVKLAYLNKHKYIGTEHLLAALIQSTDPLINKILTNCQLSAEQLRQQSILILKTVSKLPEVTENFREDSHPAEDEYQTEETAGILDYFGRNLCDGQIQKNIDPVIGRAQEISRIIEILSRRNKNNPLLLGEPGVGKTAIIEGLAKKINQGEAPDILLGKKIYTLDLAAVVAGTSYRGEFEARLKEIVSEAENRPDIILFIDEIHQLVGAGSASGSLDAANILKPALARGNLQIIGATTFGDFRKSLENDAALVRRFQMVIIEEPSAEAAQEMILGIKNYFEKFHQVKISDEAVKAAVNLSQKYLPEKFLPDKAIDLIDEAAAQLKASREPSATEKGIKAIADKIKKLEAELHQLILNDDFNGAQGLKNNLNVIRGELAKLQGRLATEKSRPRGKVNNAEIAGIIAKITNIPADELIRPEFKKVLALERELKQEIIGQEPALSALSAYLKRAKAGLMPDNRPLASFLFVGPSGVGKTHTARLLAKKFFSDEKALVKIDMSEYGEKFNLSKLIGAPAGYVGYKESGQLSEKIKHRPYSLVLLDEIEKANPEIFDLLLSVLDDGYLTDAAGSKINFTNTILVMTSNLGSQFYNGRTDIGFGGQGQETTGQKVLEEIKRFFKPEFLNRLDAIINFGQLGQKDLEKIADLELNKLAERLKKDKELTLSWQPQVAAFIAQTAAENNFNKENRGARGIKTAIRDKIETLLAERLLKERHSSKKILRLSIKNGIISLS